MIINANKCTVQCVQFCTAATFSAGLTENSVTEYTLLL